MITQKDGVTDISLNNGGNEKRFCHQTSCQYFKQRLFSNQLLPSDKIDMS